MIYLAQPYSHPRIHIREQRYQSAMKWCYKLHHLRPFSPIVHWHKIAEMYGMPTEFRFWKAINFSYLDTSSGLYALLIDGWQTSVGLNHEVRYAKLIKKPFWIVEPDTGIIRKAEYNEVLQEMTIGQDTKQQGPGPEDSQGDVSG